MRRPRVRCWWCRRTGRDRRRRLERVAPTRRPAGCGQSVLPSLGQHRATSRMCGVSHAPVEVRAAATSNMVTMTRPVITEIVAARSPVVAADCDVLLAGDGDAGSDVLGGGHWMFPSCCWPPLFRRPKHAVVGRPVEGDRRSARGFCLGRSGQSGWTWEERQRGEGSPGGGGGFIGPVARKWPITIDRRSGRRNVLAPVSSARVIERAAEVAPNCYYWLQPPSCYDCL